MNNIILNSHKRNCTFYSIMRFANILDIDVLNFKFEQTFSTNVKDFFLFQAVPEYLHTVLQK